jgi:hypothetical protein
MGNYFSFTQLVIRGCAQPLYERFHHRKTFNEIKKYYECKNELLEIFGYVNYKASITSDIWTDGKYDLGYSCITAHYIDDNWLL